MKWFLVLLGVYLVMAGKTLRAGVPFRESIQRWANYYGVNPCLVAGVISVESGFNPSAVNPSDPSYGLGQVTLRTARQYFPSIREEDLLEPDLNIRVVCRHIQQLQGPEGISMPEGIAAYNVGAAGYRAGHHTTDPNYVSKIISAMEGFC